MSINNPVDSYIPPEEPIDSNMEWPAEDKAKVDTSPSLLPVIDASERSITSLIPQTEIARTHESIDDYPKQIKTEKALMKDYQGMYESRMSDVGNLDVQIARKYTGKNLPVPLHIQQQRTDLLKTAEDFKNNQWNTAYSNTILGSAHQEALQINEQRDREDLDRAHDEALIENARINKEKMDILQDEALRMNQRYDRLKLQADHEAALIENENRDRENARRLRDERQRNAATIDKYRRTLLAALTVLGVGLGSLEAGKFVGKNYRNLPDITTLLEREDKNSEAPRPDSLNVVLSIPNNYEVIEYEVAPDWYLGPEYVEDSIDGETRYLIHTPDGPILTDPLVEYTDKEDYFIFNLPNGDAYALKKEYAVNPNNPKEMKFSIVKISEKSRN